MQPILFETIRELARTLADTLRRQQPAAEDDALDDYLTPGVAAFLGALMMMLTDQEAALLPAARRFLADPAAVAALQRYAAGEDSAGYDLYSLLLDSGLRGSALLGSYFPMAVEFLVQAANAAARRAADSPPFGDAFDNYNSLMANFVDGYYDLGLARIDLGRAVAPDGTVLFMLSPLAMAGPPEQLAEAEPEEPFGESGGGLESLEEWEKSAEPPPPPPPPSTLPPEPPPPPAPSPPPTGDVVAPLRLDAAGPERVTQGQTFDLAVAVRRPNSPPLAPGDLTRRESADFGVVWPAEAAFIRLRLQIGAPECDIEGGDSRDVRLYAGQDGPTVYFHLTPRRAGPLSLIITVYQEMDWIGSARLRTEVGAPAGAGEPRGQLTMTVASGPLNNGEANDLTLRRALDDGYNIDELRDVCFELGIDYEDLPGETQSAKARELVLYAKRHHFTAQLVALVMAARPHLLAPV